MVDYGFFATSRNVYCIFSTIEKHRIFRYRHMDMGRDRGMSPGDVCRVLNEKARDGWEPVMLHWEKCVEYGREFNYDEVLELAAETVGEMEMEELFDF